MIAMLYFLILTAMAIASVFFVDLQFPVLTFLLLNIAVLFIKSNSWRTAYHTLQENTLVIEPPIPPVEVDEPLPMARIVYGDGEIIDVFNMITDYKISADMHLYIKDRRLNKWVLQDDVIAVEFFLHETD